MHTKSFMAITDIPLISNLSNGFINLSSQIDTTVPSIIVSSIMNDTPLSYKDNIHISNDEVIPYFENIIMRVANTDIGMMIHPYSNYSVLLYTLSTVILIAVCSIIIYYQTFIVNNLRTIFKLTSVKVNGANIDASTDTQKLPPTSIAKPMNPFGTLKPTTYVPANTSINNSSSNPIYPTVHSVRDIANKFGGATTTGEKLSNNIRIPMPINKYSSSIPSVTPKADIVHSGIPIISSTPVTEVQHPTIPVINKDTTLHTTLHEPDKHDDDTDEREEDISYDEIFTNQQFFPILPSNGKSDNNKFVLSLGTDNKSFSITGNQLWKHKIPHQSAQSSSTESTITVENHPPTSPITYANVLTQSFPHTKTIRHRLSTSLSKQNRRTSVGSKSSEETIDLPVTSLPNPNAVDTISSSTTADTAATITVPSGTTTLPPITLPLVSETNIMGIQKYAKMIQVGIPRPAVEKKIQLDGMPFTMADVERFMSQGLIASTSIVQPLPSNPVPISIAKVVCSPPINTPSSLSMTNNASALQEIQAIFAKPKSAPSVVSETHLPTSNVTSISTSSLSAAGKANNNSTARISLLDTKKSMNMGILLAKFRGIPYTQLAHAIETQCSTIVINQNTTKTLSIAQIQLLLELIPSGADIQMVRRYMDQHNHDKSNIRLGEAEAYVYAVGTITDLRAKVTSLLYRENYNERYTELDQRIRIFQQITHELGSDTKVIGILQASHENSNFPTTLPSILSTIVEKGTNFRKVPSLVIQWVQHLHHRYSTLLQLSLDKDFSSLKSAIGNRLSDIDRDLMTLSHGLTGLIMPSIINTSITYRTMEQYRTEIQQLQSAYTTTYKQFIQIVQNYGIEINITNKSDTEKITSTLMMIQKFGNYIRQIPSESVGKTNK